MSAIVIHALPRDGRLTVAVQTLAFQHLENVTYAHIAGLWPVNSNEVFDVGIITYDALAMRMHPAWRVLKSRLIRHKNLAREWILLPQDDYSNTNEIISLAKMLNVSHIGSPLERGLDLIYAHIDARHVNLFHCQTGYVNRRIFSELENPDFGSRLFDVVGRVTFLGPQFGEIGQLKAKASKLFINNLQASGFSTNFSTRSENVFKGIDWLTHLQSGRFTVGTRGGSSVGDPTNRIQDYVRRWGKNECQFTEIQKAVDRLPHVKGDFSAVGPRVLECAGTKTGQILAGGHYLEGMSAWEHYLPFTPFESNDKTVREMRSEAAYKRITENMYSDFFLNAKYLDSTYARGISKLIPNLEDALTQTQAAHQDCESNLFFDPLGADIINVVQIRRVILRTYKKVIRLSQERFIDHFLRLSKTSNNSQVNDATVQTACRWIEAIKRGQLEKESLYLDWDCIDQLNRSFGLQ